MPAYNMKQNVPTPTIQTL